MKVLTPRTRLWSLDLKWRLLYWNSHSIHKFHWCLERALRARSDNRMEVVFPAPGLILNELFQLYNDKSNVNERNSAIIDYIRLIFQNIK